jgi:uncharacterized protein YdcH (DUF465 family)
MKNKNPFEECHKCGVPDFLHSTYCGWGAAGFLTVPGMSTNLDINPFAKEATWHFWKPHFTKILEDDAEILKKFKEFCEKEYSNTNISNYAIEQFMKARIKLKNTKIE